MIFAAQRLSRHFTLLDMLQARTLHTSRQPLRLADIPLDCIATGKRLCAELLEPMIDTFGPCSIASGYIPKALLSERWTPHTWFSMDGAAVDASFHDWVNAGKAPIKLVEEVVRLGAPFERIITYAGSEFICLSAGRRQNRGVIYENVRIPGSEKPQFRTLCRAGSTPSLPFPDRPDWRRLDDEPVFHSQRSLRAQHIRVGRYFTFLDFCRNEEAIIAGIDWVPPLTKTPLIEMARCMAEVLDPVVAQVGRISVVRGVIRPDMSGNPTHTWFGPRASVSFLLPEGQEPVDIEHPGLVDYGFRETSAGWLGHVTINRFQPARIWSSGTVVRERVRKAA